VREFGEVRGKKLSAQAIKEYGKKLAEARKKKAAELGIDSSADSFMKLRNIPTFGMHDHREQVVVDGRKRNRAYGCVLARTWHEYGQDALGRIYCYVDPAVSMAFNPEFKLAHLKAEPDGDAHCELMIKPTSAADRIEFAKEDTDWASVDK